LIDLTTEGLALWKSKSEAKFDAKAAIPCQCKGCIIGLARELSMKTPNCIKTGLMAAFRAPGAHIRASLRTTASAKPLQTVKSLRQFD
jgi:hypothetical protein